MANSGTVTAGSAALASQYNNLRDDVLNISTGHTHTGASENGAKIEGTVIKSTGATAGQVLQADGSANAVWVTSAQAGALTSATATVTFAAAAAEYTYYNGVNNSANYWGVFTNGSTIFCIDSTLAVTTGRAARIFPYGTAATYGGSISPSATATLTNTLAGTVRAMAMPYLGFGAGTSSASSAVYYGELVTATTTGVVSLTFRKWNLSLSSNIWSANFGTAVALTAGTPIVTTGIKYMQEANSWFTVRAASGTATALAYHINDSTGALSSANYPIDTVPTGYVFVPSTGGTAAGTVHVWGTSSTQFVRCAYSVGTATITALSTATNASAFSPTAYFGNPILIGWGDAWYDRTEESIVITSNQGHDGYSNGNLIGLDRSFGTQLFNSLQAGTAADSSRAIGFPSYETILNEKPFDHVSRTVSWKTSGNLTNSPAFMVMGKNGAYYNASPKAQIYEASDSTNRTSFVTNYSGFTGPGSALRPWIWKQSNFEMVQYAPLVYTEGTVLAAASVGRIVTMAENNTQGAFAQMTIVAKDAFKFSFDAQAGVRSGTVAASLTALARFPMYLPAGQPLVVGFTGRSTGVDAQIAGTATVVFKAINLA